MDSTEEGMTTMGKIRWDLIDWAKINLNLIKVDKTSKDLTGLDKTKTGIVITVIAKEDLIISKICAALPRYRMIKLKMLNWMKT